MTESSQRNIKFIVDTKNKILKHIKKTENQSAISLLNKVFTDEFPPDTEFLSRIYQEFNKIGAIELAFQVIEGYSKVWEGDSDYQILRKNARNVFFNNLVSNGNKLLSQRDERAAHFSDALKRVDTLAKDKVASQNEKILVKMTQNSLSIFCKAHELEPENISVLSGMYRCYRLLGNEKQVEILSEKLEELSPILAGKAKQAHEQTPDKLSKQRNFSIEEFNIREVERLFQLKKYQETIDKVNFLHLSNRLSVPLLILKTESLIALKRFKEADATVDEADKTNTCYKEVMQLQEQVREIKFGLLSKAGEAYLTKAVELGKSLGKGHFFKAKQCIQQAIELYTNNIDLYDHLYTIHKYLGEEDEAFRAKANIYRLNKKHIPTFDQEGMNSLCFLASYAYANSPKKLEEFRWFRREILLSSNLGRRFNSKYVKLSPYVLRISNRLYISPWFFRLLLLPIRLIIKVASRFH